MTGSTAGQPGQRPVPPGGEVPSLPFVGRTWYARRGGYWLRRAAALLLRLGLLGFVTFVTAAILIAIAHRSAAGFYAMVTIEAVYSLAFLGWFAARTARMWNIPADPADPAALRRGGRKSRPEWARGPKRLAYAAGHVLLAISWMSLGFHLAFLLSSLMREPLSERRARLLVTARQQNGPAAA